MIDVICVFGAGVTTLSQDTLESRSAVGRFCTVGLLGAVVTSGKWYWEITPRCPGSAMQVGVGARAYAFLVYVCLSAGGGGDGGSGDMHVIAWAGRGAFGRGVSLALKASETVAF